MSSSSLLDSAFSSSSILGASSWNQQKAERCVRGRPLVVGGVEDDTDTQEQPQKQEQQPRQGHTLLDKRRYPNPVVGLLAADATEDKGKEDAGTSTCSEKTELESAVLLDCLSSHFLFSHSSKEGLQRLSDTFTKRRYRNHEVIYSKGDESKYFYILYSGEVTRRGGKKNDENQDDEAKYTVLGELAVLTGTPYQETVVAASNCVLFRLDRGAFHRALRPTTEFDLNERVNLLKRAIPEEMVDHFVETELTQLASTMSSRSFQAGDLLVTKETRLDSLVIIAKGVATATDVSLGGRSYDDILYGPEAPRISFGWQSLLTGSKEPTFRGNIVARSDGIALMLSHSSFRNVLGGGEALTLEHLAARRLARIELQQIPMFQDSLLDDIQINSLLDLMHRCEFSSDEDGEKITMFKASEKVDACMYFVREGAVTLILNKGEDQKIVEAGGYFGEQNMLRDQNKDGQKHFVIRSPMTALAHAPRTVVDALYLEECRGLVNTTLLGLGQSGGSSSMDASIQWEDIDRHALLGTGTFGQVWMASIPRDERPDESSCNEAEEKKSPAEEGTRRIVALKIQSKYQVVEAGKAERVVAERNILASLHSPFLLRHVCSFQDESRLYMITSLLQGGELESLIPDDGLSEESAKFYAAGILEGLAYMHRHHVIHRDIKPQNVLLNERGYPVLIDFGFAKYVPDKTYTFCGSPIFTAPEIIRFQGHGRASDNWAWAVLVYRLVTGRYPFYRKGLDELELYKRICKGSLELDGLMSMEFRMLMVAVLYPNPLQRLGSSRNGWRDIFASPWFANEASFDLRKLRKQAIVAPWVPHLKDPLDASSFHPDASDMEDLMDQTFPQIGEKQQKIFSTFGPQI